LSDFAFFILCYVTGYRKAVVLDNLTQAFPEKTSEEINGIMRRFYRSFCDQWIETVKLMSMSETALNRRMTGNWDVFEQLNLEGRNAYAMLGHMYNWEWASLLTQYRAPQQFAGIYLPVSNKAFDRLMLKIRSRSGALLVSMKSMKTGLQQLQHKRHIVGMIADQNPSQPDVALWLPFLHREAPFFKGPEAMARRAKGAVVFVGMKKMRRGHYAIHLQKMWDDASLTAPGEITQAYVTFLEQQLREQPENWLWSHRRWKHKKKTSV
jgi:KDO2-lipid IV(A) lauroyltransferase